MKKRVSLSQQFLETGNFQIILYEKTKGIDALVVLGSHEDKLREMGGVVQTDGYTKKKPEVAQVTGRGGLQYWVEVQI